ncbi:hypothetical protein DRN45_05050, partial [Thermococci archaeon]
MKLDDKKMERRKMILDASAIIKWFTREIKILCHFPDFHSLRFKNNVMAVMDITKPKINVVSGLILSHS